MSKLLVLLASGALAILPRAGFCSIPHTPAFPADPEPTQCEWEDTDFDGVEDTCVTGDGRTYYDIDGDGDPEAMSEDLDGDGDSDVEASLGEDGRPETIEVDYDDDGQSDSIGVDLDDDGNLDWLPIPEPGLESSDDEETE